MNLSKPKLNNMNIGGMVSYEYSFFVWSSGSILWKHKETEDTFLCKYNPLQILKNYFQLLRRILLKSWDQRDIFHFIRSFAITTHKYNIILNKKISRSQVEDNWSWKPICAFPFFFKNERKKQNPLTKVRNHRKGKTILRIYCNICLWFYILFSEIYDKKEDIHLSQSRVPLM